jgi:tetratricopeptide (TPR) repeat protein
MVLLTALAACSTTPPIQDYREAEAVSDQALVLMNEGDNKRAIQLLGRVIKYNGGEVRDLNRRATAYAAEGRLDESIRDLDRAVVQDARNWETFLLRGVAHQKSANYAKAVKDFEAARKLSPNDAGILRQLAYALLLDGEFTQAANSFGELKEMRPAAGIGPFGHGVALYLAGDWPGAASAFEVELSRNPYDGLLAMWLAKASLRAKAPLAWEQFSDRAGPEPEWVMVKALLSSQSVEDVERDLKQLQKPQQDRRTVGTCEGVLFLGAWAKVRGLDEVAREQFSSAQSSCPADSIEMVEARTELSR